VIAMLATALVLGAIGSAHCIGMCGPIALAVPARDRSLQARLESALLMNTGRIITYALIGVAFGAFGHGLRLAGLQRGISISAGVLLLLMALVPSTFGLSGRIGLWIARLRSLTARHLDRTAPEALLFTGMLNGLLPCGLVYTAALGATVTGGALHGALFMLAFGVGTWPALIGVRMSGALIGMRGRRLVRRAGPLITCTIATLLILRGLGLGIPFVSPPAPDIDPSVVQVCH